MILSFREKEIIMICSFNVIRVLSCPKYISLRLFEELFFYSIWDMDGVEALYNFII